MKALNAVLLLLVLAGAVAICAQQAHDRRRPGGAGDSGNSSEQSLSVSDAQPTNPKPAGGSGPVAEPGPALTPLQKKWRDFLKASEKDMKKALLDFGPFLRTPHPEIRKELTEALGHSSKEVRAAAVANLGKQDGEDVSLILCQRLDAESDLYVRAAYWQAFASHADDSGAVQKLQDIIKSGDSASCTGSVFALSYGGTPEDAIQVLTKMYDSSSDRHRKYSIATGIGRLAERGNSEAQDELVRVFRATEDAREKSGLYAWIKKSGLLSRMTQTEIDAMEATR